MKKIIVLLLTAVMIFSFSGCFGMGMIRELTLEEKNAIEVGTIADGVYENTTFAFGFTAEDGWKLSAAEDVLALNNWTAEDDLKSQAIASLGKPGYFYEMTAEREDSKASVNVCVENVSVIEQPDISEEDYVARAVVSARELFEEAGCQDMVITNEHETFAGADHYFYHVSCKTNDGVQLYYKAMYIKEGIYVAVVTATSAEEDLTDEVLSMFYQA